MTSIIICFFTLKFWIGTYRKGDEDRDWKHSTSSCRQKPLSRLIFKRRTDAANRELDVNQRWLTGQGHFRGQSDFNWGRCPSGPTPRSAPAARHWKNLRRYCGLCRSPLHDDDSHSECVCCLGKSHADAVLIESDCSHCDNISLTSLRSRIAFFSESNFAPHTLPFFPCRDLWGKNRRAEDLSVQLKASSRCLRAHVPRSRHTNRFFPSYFPQPVQLSLVWGEWRRAEWRQHVISSFGRKGAVGLGSWPRPPAFVHSQRSKDRVGCRTSPHPLKGSGRAVSGESPPEGPSRSRLDEWFLQGRRQAPHQRSSPFFLEVHDELTRSWLSPYSACLRTSASSALTTVYGAEEKGYEKMPPLYESVAAHLCPPSTISWKAKAAHSSKPCRTTTALAGRS